MIHNVSIAFALGTASAGTIFNAAFPSGFWLINLPVLGSAALGAAVGGGGLGLTIGAATGAYLVFTLLMHREAHRDLLASVSGRLRLEQLATHDALTGLPNRTALIVELAPAPERSLLYVDLDRFKVVNDALGHDAGDRLLVEVARRFREELGEDGTLYRVGGDELVALVRPGREEAAAARLRAALGRPVRVFDRDLHVTTSIGIAVPAPGDSGQDLLRHADAALYQAKDRGRDRVERFDEALRARLRRRVDEEVDLRRAIAAGEIEPWYQAIVDLHSGEIVGAEALARWRHPSRGLVPAGQFVPVVEEVGLGGVLTERIVQRVIADVAAWRSAGVPPIRVKVNLGAELFARPDLAAWLTASMRAGDCPPDALGVEVTETGLLRDVKLAAAHLRTLRDAGLTVALDDFGTAWSSLALLRQLPLDTVKIDRMFVSGLPDREADRALVGAVTTMARHLGLDVVAEGVENEAQAHGAASLGCDMAQGYLFAPALAADDFRALLLRRPFERQLAIRSA